MNDVIDPIIVLNAFGVNDVTEIVPHAGGWGGTMLWRVQRRATPRDLLLRLFPHGALRLARREEIAHRTASQAGVPVPKVIASGVSGAHAALLLTWCRGEQVTDHLRRAPDRSYEVGIVFGETLARIHTIPGPASLAALLQVDSTNDWLSWTGPYAERLRVAFAARHPNDLPSRLLHMDYHPENVLCDDTSITAVIDWANVRVGPPCADLARSRSILRLAQLHPGVSEAFHAPLACFEQGMLDAHARVHGPREDEEFFLAWASAVQIVDLGSQIGRPGVWLTPDAFATLRDECDRRVSGL